ncbi:MULTISPECIES: universal stress protein [Massilia]|jgi:nucleotide-binding universal stress UspA family protein|uniref:Universal stress protein n=2 Tax=Massilia TaxID=149698 RepID=A0A7X3G5Y0_9BURK|nr:MULTISPECIES: universal stress protein [Telluria group]KQX96949.1 universal stress protein UspA [Massilia sp. Root133]KQZ52654.1 universal stress protein UspA [Massilia sp. Root1485]MDN4044698.1 universal stress protein [Massilia sp. YIM B02787]MVW63312.1 universal stress protein [Telluria cellulosilytica]
MYQKILITTDGSSVSQHTACAGVKFARQMGAEVLALFVAPEYQYPVYVEIVPPAYPSEEEYVQQMKRLGEEYMGSIMRAAEGCGLKHACMTAFSDAAALKIVDVAEQQHCDLIFMGSHGRSGWGQLLLGSVTNKVLSHTTKPVLVHRLIREPGT